MELKEGYKNTEIGVIPEDWTVISFDKAFYFLSTASYSRAEISKDADIKYVHYGDIHTKLEHFLDFNHIELPTIKNEQLKTYSLIKEGDLIMADASEDYEGIGKSVEVRNIGNNKAISGLHTFLLRGKEGVFSNEFKAYLYSNKIIKTQYDKLATGLKVYGVSKGNLKSIQIPLPSLPEQTAIATVLSDTDSLIQALEKKIAKKQLIKKGAMQKLLAPKEGWEVKTLGEIAKFRRGSFPQPYGLPQWYDENNGMPFVQVFDVDKNMKLKSTTKQKISDLAKDKSVFVRKGTIVLTIQGSIGRIAVTQYDTYVDRTLLIFTDYQIPMDIVFFSFIVQEKFRIEKEDAPGGIIRTITKEALSKFEVSFPKIKQEQTRIAQILSDMDNEIEVLQNKLGKYKQLKQGLMQNLLTGKIRLV